MIGCDGSLRFPPEADEGYCQCDFHRRQKVTHGHRDSRVSFSYGGHRRTNEGSVEGDVASNLGLEGDIAGRELDPPGKDEEIVVGEGTVDLSS